MLREVERASDDIAEFQCNLATSQYPIPIESQITMRADSYSSPLVDRILDVAVLSAAQ